MRVNEIQGVCVQKLTTERKKASFSEDRKVETKMKEGIGNDTENKQTKKP